MPNLGTLNISPQKLFWVALETILSNKVHNSRHDGPLFCLGLSAKAMQPIGFAVDTEGIN